MTEQISLLAVYDRLAAVDTKIEALMARTSERLDSGSRRLEDHEARLRNAEGALPERLGERLTALESARDQWKGRTSVLTIVLSLAGSSSASALISYLLTRH